MYGHVHGMLVAEDEAADNTLTMDVGVDARDYKPVSFEEVYEYNRPRLKKFKERAWVP